MEYIQENVWTKYVYVYMLKNNNKVKSVNENLK